MQSKQSCPPPMEPLKTKELFLPNFLITELIRKRLIQVIGKLNIK